MTYRFEGGGIGELLRRARRAGLLDRVEPERDRLANALGVPLTPAERETLRSVSAEMLRVLLGALDGDNGPLAKPRPILATPERTRGIRPG